jgi:hypothetical protein
MSNIYDNMDAIAQKKLDSSPPTDTDKEILQHRLLKLSKSDHLYLFKEIIQGLKKKIYTVTENCILFDLNDLPHDCFWKIYYHVQLSMQNLERTNVIQETLAKDIKNNAKTPQLTPKCPIIDIKMAQTPYEKLRTDALIGINKRECKNEKVPYFNYNIKNIDDICNVDDKCMNIKINDNAGVLSNILNNNEIRSFV